MVIMMFCDDKDVFSTLTNILLIDIVRRDINVLQQ